jgi:hypothetical protein
MLHLVGYILEYWLTHVYSSTNPIFMCCSLFNKQDHTCHKLLVVSLSLQGFGFDLRSLHVGFVVDKVALGLIFVWERWGFFVSASFFWIWCQIFVTLLKKVKMWTILQVILGISTLLMYVPVPLAASHQSGSLVLLSLAVWLTHELRYVKRLPK